MGGASFLSGGTHGWGIGFDGGGVLKKSKKGGGRMPSCPPPPLWETLGFRVLLHKLKSYGISGRVFSHISSFLSNRWLQVVLDGKSSQEYPVNDLPDDVICNIAIYDDDTTLYSKCDRLGKEEKGKRMVTTHLSKASG